MIKSIDEQTSSQILVAILHRFLEKDRIKRREFGNSLMMNVELKSPDGVIHKLVAKIGNADYRVTKIQAEEVQTEVKGGEEKRNEQRTLESTEEQN